MKRFTAFLIILMMIPVLFVPSKAAVTADTFYIEGNTYTDMSKNLSGNGWNWTASTRTLTLNNYNDEAIIFLPANEENPGVINLIVKGNNYISYDPDNTSYKIKGDITMLAAIYFKCQINMNGGGILNLTATDYNGGWLSYGLSMENVTLNSKAPYAALRSLLKPLTAKNCILNLDSSAGFATPDFLFENCTFTYKHTSPYKEGGSEEFSCGFIGTFKNCTIDVYVGARTVNNTTPFSYEIFSNSRATLDNTVLRVKKSVCTNYSYSRLYQIMDIKEWSIHIKNGTKIEFDVPISKVFECSNIYISDSSIKGIYREKVFESNNTVITNSNIDLKQTDIPENDSGAFRISNLDIKNSKIKLKTTKSAFENAGFLAFGQTAINVKIADSELDIEGGKTSTGNFTLNYSKLSDWEFYVNGQKTDYPNVNMAEPKIVIKKAVQSVVQTPSSAPSNNGSTNNVSVSSSAPSDNASADVSAPESSPSDQVSSSEAFGDLTSQTESSDISVSSDTVLGSDAEPIVPLPKKQPVKIILLCALGVLVLSGGTVAAIFLIKKYKK